MAPRRPQPDEPLSPTDELEAAANGAEIDDSTGDDHGGDDRTVSRQAVTDDERPGRTRETNSAFVEDPRDSIAKGFDNRRKAARGVDVDEDDPPEDNEDEAALHGDDDAEDEAIILRPGETLEDVEEGRREPPAGRQPAAKPQSRLPQVVKFEDDDLVPLIVNGVEIEVPFRDLKARSQQLLAADTMFAEAKNVLNAARDARAKPSADPDDDDAGNQGDDDTRTDNTRRAGSRETSAIDDARLREVTDKLQGGTLEEGQEALRTLVEDVLAASGNQRPTAELFAEFEAKMRLDTEVDRALADFSSAYGDAFTPEGEHNDLAPAIFRNASREMIDDLRGIGVPEDYLSSLGSDFKAIGDAHTHYRHDPEFKGAPWRSKLRDYSAIIMKSADAVAVKYGIERASPQAERRPVRREERREEPRREPGSPPRIRVSEARRVEKREVPLQPRSASIRSDARQANQPARLTQGRMSSVVDEIRAGRQQPTVR